MLRYWTAGESHGPALTALVDGFPAGLPVDTDVIDSELQRRQRRNVDSSSRIRWLIARSFSASCEVGGRAVSCVHPGSAPKIVTTIIPHNVRASLAMHGRSVFC